MNLYIRSLETERYPIDTLTDSMVMYLIGALYADLGVRDKAVLYLSRLVDEKNRRNLTDEKLYRDARRLWQAVREGTAETVGGTEPEAKAEQEQAAKEQAAKEKATVPAKKAAPAKKKSGFSRWFS